MGLLDSIRRAFTAPQAILDAQAAQGMDTQSYMGPGTPLQPRSGYSVPPRAMDYPIAVNTNTRNRTQYGRTSFEKLHELLNAYDFAQVCMRHKIDELRSMEPIFQAMDGFTGDPEIAIKAAKAALSYPDRDHPWDEWLTMWLTSLLTYGQGPLYRHRDMEGKIIGLRVVDGGTMYALIDEDGLRPKAPAPAYQQVIKGGNDKQFTAEDIIWALINPQTDSPYGMAPLESILLTVNTDLRHQWHLLQMFTEGNIPGGFMEAPPDLSSPDQIQEFQEVWNATFDGDQSQKHKIVFVPAGAKFTETAPKSFDPLFPEWLAKKTAMAFGVVPQDLGFTADVNRANGETQVDIQFRVNTLPWVRMVEGHMTRYLQRDLGLPVEFRLNTGRDKEDRLAEASAWKVYIEMGMASPDEGREELLGLPVDNERPIPRGLILPRQGFVPFDSVLAIAGKTDPETKAPTADAELPYPFDGTPGLVPDKLPGGADFKRAPKNPDDPEHPAAQRPVPGTGNVPTPAETAAAAAQPAAVTKKKHTTPVAAGLAVVAGDTGHVLMTQRGHNRNDPASDRWEFPGGHIEAGETPLDAAVREWGEETGLQLPHGVVVGDWLSKDGGYVGHVYLIPYQGQLPQDLGQGRLVRGGDPGGDEIQAIAWFDPQDAATMKGIRKELKTAPWGLIGGAPDEGRRGELLKFNAFAARRRKTGRWRDFEFVFHTEAEATELNKAAAPDPKGWRAEPPSPTPYHRIDLALTDYWAERVAAALQASVDPAELAGEALAAGWSEAEAASLAVDMMDTTRLVAVIRLAQQDGFIGGALAAGEQNGATGLLDGFKPGAAATWQTPHTMPLPVMDALTGSAWLNAAREAGVTVRGLTDTTLQHLGALIGEAVLNGDPVHTLARKIDALLGDASRAEMIAHTETARMATNASMAVYRAYGVTQWDWVVSAGACPRCTAEAERNPHRMGDTQPPGHPRCRCAASPHTS